MTSHQRAQHKRHGTASTTSLQDQPKTSKMREENDIFTDAEHNDQDKAVNQLLSYLELYGSGVRKKIILDVVVQISREKLRLPEDLTQLEKDIPGLYDLLEESLKTGSYRKIRNLPQLRKPLPGGGPQVMFNPSGTESASNWATDKSWQQTFEGKSAETLHKIIQSYMDKNAYLGIFARYAIFSQSSGTGKSRMTDELAKQLLCIPVNLSGTSLGFPPVDRPAAAWFNHGLSREVCKQRSEAFLYGVLVQLKLELESVERDMAWDVSDNDVRRLSLASRFRDKMSEGMTFNNHGQYRQLFYKNVEKLAEKFLESTPSQDQARGVVTAAEELLQYLNPNNNNTLAEPLVVFCFDESDVLTQPVTGDKWTPFSELLRGLRLLHNMPIFSLFLTTAGRFHQFAPYLPVRRTETHSSNRLAGSELGSLPPIVEVGFDMLAKKVSLDGTWNLDQLASTYHMCHLGRPLFATRYDQGGETVKWEILRFAHEKLLCGFLPVNVPNKVSLSPDQALACLAVRLSLEFKATAWGDREKERTQVERHMRLCLFASPGFQNIITVGPSEPLLAEAACQVMKGYYSGLERPDVVKTLLDHLESSDLEPGWRGELIAQLLVLLARDKACKDQPAVYHADPESGDKRDGQWRIITVPEFLEVLLNEEQTSWKFQTPSVYHTGENAEQPLHETFADCHIWFNHFVKVTDYDVINQDYLWRFLTRGAAIVCATNQAGVDIVIPFLCGKKLLKENVSAILIQVKNDKRFTTNIKSSLFTVMNPFSVGLFAAKVANPPPVIRMVLALASPSSAVTSPKRRSSHLSKVTGAFTAYDIWCAGAVSETFGIIDGAKGNKGFAELLRHSQAVQGAYTVRASQKVGGARAESRRMMVPGTSIEEQHFANYTTDVVPEIELLDEEELEWDSCDDDDDDDDNVMVVDQQQ